MALETVEFSLTDTYTQIGDSVTALSAHSRGSEGYDVHVVEAGGSAPTGGSSKVTVDAVFNFTGVAADICAKATASGDTFTLEVVRS